MTVSDRSTSHAASGATSHATSGAASDAASEAPTDAETASDAARETASTPAEPTPPSTTAAPVLATRFAQGFAMGSADVIPGVSGGTIALILGIYRRLIAAIRSLAQAPGALLRGRMPAAVAHVREVPWSFVLPVGVGMVTALGIGSVILPDLLEQFPVETNALFFGLIVASLAVPWRQATLDGVTATVVGVAVASAVAAFVVMGLPEAEVVDPPLWRVFASAMVAICAMILPGVSGAFLLLALGIYEPTLEAVSDGNLPYVATFVVGAVVGLGAFSRLLHFLLEHHLAVTMAALTGLMVGALRVLWPWEVEGGGFGTPATGGDVVVALAWAAVGFAVVTALLRLGRRRAATG